MRKFFILMIVLLLALPFISKTIDEIVVKVNDSVITKDEYEKRLNQTIEGFKREYKGPDFDEKFKDIPQRLLKQMTEELLLIEKAKQLYQVDMIVKMQIENFMKENSIKDEAELEKLLKNEGLTLEEFKRQMKLIYVPEFMKSREIRSKISLTPKEIEDYYNNNKEKLQGKPQIHLLEILLTKDKYNEESAKQAYSDILIMLAQGKSFQDVAKLYSLGYSRNNGGDAGWYSPDDLSKEIKDAVFGMKEGQVSQLIDTKQGYYIFKIAERKEPKVPSFDEARDFVIEMIKEEKFEESYKNYIDQLKKENYVRINPKYV